MANSNAPYGFRLYRIDNGGEAPPTETVTLASNVGCKPGDVLHMSGAVCYLLAATGTQPSYVAQGTVTAVAATRQNVSAIKLFPGYTLRFQTTTLSAGNVGKAYDIVPTTGAGYLNTGATSYVQITVDRLAPGSAYGAYAEALGHVAKGQFVD